MEKSKVAVVGSGPAGYAAALYTSRAGIETTVFAGDEPGGQLMKTAEVENYPGFPEGIMGPELMTRMQRQAERFGARVVWEAVVKGQWSMDKGQGAMGNGQGAMGKGQFELVSNAGTSYQADAVILAMGASPRLLGVGEEAYFGKGFSTCAVCDAPFYREKHVYIVGGGDAAAEDALALAKFARSVVMIVRGATLRASQIMQRRVRESADKIRIEWESEVVGVEGGERVEAVQVRVRGGEVTRRECEGLFLAIGHTPATAWLEGSGVKLDNAGYVLIGDNKWPTMTSISGVFAGGDCVDTHYRQAATAVGMGVAAALEAERWLEETR